MSATTSPPTPRKSHIKIIIMGVVVIAIIAIAASVLLSGALSNNNKNKINLNNLAEPITLGSTNISLAPQTDQYYKIYVDSGQTLGVLMGGQEVQNGEIMIYNPNQVLVLTSTSLEAQGYFTADTSGYYFIDAKIVTSVYNPANFALTIGISSFGSQSTAKLVTSGNYSGTLSYPCWDYYKVYLNPGQELTALCNVSYFFQFQSSNNLEVGPNLVASAQGYYYIEVNGVGAYTLNITVS
jgi:hypothetical protein